MTTFYTFNTLVDPDQGADTDIRPFGQFYAPTSVASQCYNALFGKGNYDGPDPNLAANFEMQDNTNTTKIVDSSGNERHGYLKDQNGTLGGEYSFGTTSDLSFEDGPTGYLPRSLHIPGLGSGYDPGEIAFGVNTNTRIDWADIPESQGATFIGWLNIGPVYASAMQFRRLAHPNPLAPSDYKMGVHNQGNAGWTAQYINTGDYVGTTLYDTPNTGADRLSPATWHHTAYTFKDLNRTIFRNGQEVETTTSGATIQYLQSAGFYLGGWGYHAGMAIFDRELSDAEIAEAYSGPEPYAQSMPSITGTPTVGEFVTINAGVWNSQNNGSIRYTYKMYSSSDTNGTDQRLEKEVTSYLTAQKILIRGSRLVGRYLSFEISAENDGGTDPLEVYNTGYTAAIGSGTDPTYVSYNALFGYGKHVPDPELKGLVPFDEDPLTNDPVKYGEWQVNPIAGTPLLENSGPTSYITKSVSFDATDGTDDVITFDTVNSNNAQDYTIGYWLNAVTTGTGGATGSSFSFGSPGYVRAHTNFGFDNYGYSPVDAPEISINGFGANAGYNTWNHFVARNDYGTRASLHLNGSEYGFSTGGSGDMANAYLEIGRYSDQSMAWFWLINRVLSDTEVAESYNGPEPVNITPATISGDFRVGFTISVNAGVWDSQNNGTITQTYQWYRADDANGTNLTAIPGETGSTYVLSFDDHQKYVTVKERASNDGGYDELEDTYATYTSEIGLKGGMLLVKAG